jgi:two-component system chemotaxis response regulator CheB/chemosensory pili system protein ChpB (putative protein-glutamate methylesterase)
VPESSNLLVAILQSAQEAHLKKALQDLGASVVYEAPPANIDRDKLESSGARVVIVNLDADSDNYIDHLYDVLDAGDYEVVFNDAQVSANLQGWDQARWARNLAAKLLHNPKIAEPPRPPGAEPVPTPAQTLEANVPVAEKPGPAKHPPAELPPTVEMPVPGQLREPAPPEKGGLDIGALADFADLIAPPEPALPPPMPPSASPKTSNVAEVATNLPSDFGAELDALFAAADAKQPPKADAAAGGGLEIDTSGGIDLDLPAEFSLGEIADEPPTTASELDIDIPFGDLEAVEPPAPPPPPPVPKAAPVPAAPKLPPLQKAGPGGFDDFPAIFDQLDLAAGDVPEASDTTFKPAALPEKPVERAGSSFPADWGLEDFDLGADEAAKPGAPAKLERLSAADFLAPEVEESSAEIQHETMPTGDIGGLQLMPMEDAIAPQNQPQQAAAAQNAPLKVGTGAGVQRVFVLGASIGGPEAVRDFLGALPVRFPVLFVLAQHMGEEFLELMSAQLAKAVKLTVRKPTHGERVSHGEVLIVPTTHRLQVDAEGVVTLAHLREKSQYSPSIDQVLHDIADQFGPRAGVIVFSGMAHDAIEGSQYLKSRGGTVWVQDPETCVVSSMVDGARAAGVVDFMGSPQQLAAKMVADYGKA